MIESDTTLLMLVEPIADKMDGFRNVGPGIARERPVRAFVLGTSDAA